MNLVHHVVGSFGTNVWLLADDTSSEAIVIDPGADCERLVGDARQAGLRVKYVAVTHGHGDHTGAVATVVGELGASFVAHRGDGEEIANPSPWIVEKMPGFANPPPVDLWVDHGDQLLLGESVIDVIATPGHTPGSVCYLYAGPENSVVFTGDTLFKGTIGRYDLPGGDGKQEVASIKTHLMALPNETRVMPGHGPTSTIGDERETNPFLT